MINPWEHPLSIWKTKAKYFVWVRGQLRRSWADNPLRKKWKARQLRKISQEERKSKKYHSSTKNVGQCSLCEKWFAGSKLEVDHKQESDGCYDFATAEKFLWHCLADDPDNWQLVCKPCHKVKSYADRQGISFEEARVEKDVIAKCKQPVGQQKEELLSLGFSEEDIANKEKRRECYRRYYSGDN